MKTKTMAAGKFKTRCLAVMDEVQAKREALIITKRGKPVVKIIPVEPPAGRHLWLFAGKGQDQGGHCGSCPFLGGVG